MPYQKDSSGKIKLKKIDKFWHPVKKDGSISTIKGNTKQKALNAVHAYDAISHTKKNH